MDYEPDADMLFNYLLVAALAESTDTIDSENLKPSEGNKKQTLFGKLDNLNLMF